VPAAVAVALRVVVVGTLGEMAVVVASAARAERGQRLGRDPVAQKPQAALLEVRDNNPDERGSRLGRKGEELRNESVKKKR
jgi:hypothetical protein